MTTVTIEAPRPLKHNDVLFAVSKLAEHCEVDSRSVGKISICEDTKEAVFDLPSAEAFKLVKFAQEQDLKKFKFEVCSELPKLQTYNGGRGGGYGRGGGGGYGRGGGGGYRGGGGGGGGYRGGGGGGGYRGGGGGRGGGGYGGQRSGGGGGGYRGGGGGGGYRGGGGGGGGGYRGGGGNNY
jgi:hypothetical protein